MIIFIHDTDKASEGDLMVLFFGLFSLPLPLEVFLPTPLVSGSIFLLLCTFRRIPVGGNTRTF